jgi:hypothetical protein
MTTITVPASLEDAVSALSGIEGLLTAKEWERAAIVAAFTDDGTPGPKVDRGDSTAISCRAFAAMGISGLRSDQTVRNYRKAWMDEVGRAPEPGQEVALPSTPWPPTDYRTGNYDQRIHSHLANSDPAELAQEIREQNPAAAAVLAQDPQAEQGHFTDPLTKDERDQANYEQRDRVREVKERQAANEVTASDFAELDLIADVSRLRQEVEALVAHWSHRNLAPSAEATNILTTDLATVRDCIGLLFEISEGREGVDVELQRLVEENRS